MCFALFGFALGGVSAQEPPFIWQLDGGIYYMISPPYVPEDRDPQVSLTDDLGSYDKTQWRFFRYNPARGAYAELKSADWEAAKHDLDFGRGYWIISLNQVEIDIDGEPIGAPVVEQIILEHAGDGWNQIGNIFDYDFPIVSLYVVRTDDPDPWYNKVQLIDPVNNDLTYVTLQEFENGNYIDIPAIGKTSLEAGKAYWLRVNVDVDVILWFVIRGPNTLSNGICSSDEFLERVAQQEVPPDPPTGVESSSSVSGSGSGGGCFIATAAYGDFDHPMVQLMREFRDRYLLANSFGRVFVDMYYRYSPTLASFVADSKPSKILIRFGLMPVVAIIAIVSEMNVYGLLIVLVFPFLGSFVSFRRRKGAWGECKPTFSGTIREKGRD